MDIGLQCHAVSFSTEIDLDWHVVVLHGQQLLKMLAFVLCECRIHCSCEFTQLLRFHIKSMIKFQHAECLLFFLFTLVNLPRLDLMSDWIANTIQPLEGEPSTQWTPPASNTPSWSPVWEEKKRKNHRTATNCVNFLLCNMCTRLHSQKTIIFMYMFISSSRDAFSFPVLCTGGIESQITCPFSHKTHRCFAPQYARWEINHMQNVVQFNGVRANSWNQIYFSSFSASRATTVRG